MFLDKITNIFMLWGFTKEVVLEADCSIGDTVNAWLTLKNNLINLYSRFGKMWFSFVSQKFHDRQTDDRHLADNRRQIYKLNVPEPCTCPCEFDTPHDFEVSA